jgi:predicted secreted protein
MLPNIRPLHAPRARLLASLLALAAAMAPGVPAHAQAAAGMPSAPIGGIAPPAAAGVVMLSAAATVHVPRDWISVTFSTTRDGTDPQAVQAQLKQATDAARALVPTWRTPEAGQAQTGTFSLQPRYGTKGQITGWTGTSSLIVEGTDVAGISQLAGRIGTLTVAGVEMGLAPATRDRAEAEATAQAIARYRTRAEAVAASFGYAHYELRDVTVQGEGPTRPRPMMMRSDPVEVTGSQALPVESGDENVVVNVTGRVQLLH